MEAWCHSVSLYLSSASVISGTAWERKQYRDVNTVFYQQLTLTVQQENADIFRYLEDVQDILALHVSRKGWWHHFQYSCGESMSIFIPRIFHRKGFMSLLQKPMSTHCHSPKIYRDCCRHSIISNSVCKAGRILHERYVVCEETDCWEVSKKTKLNFRLSC